MTPRQRTALTIAGSAAAFLTAVAANILVAKKSERDNPPKGKFLRIAGVWLHYVEEGVGEPLVLLHGNGTMIEDFRCSGLLDLAAAKYRVIAFDRPGFGHSTRPRGPAWTPEAQADLIHKALAKLNVRRATVFAHSWGAFVAIALALKYPALVRSLVLASGYYFPPKASLAAPPKVGSFVDEILRFTIMPVVARLTLPGVQRGIFAPAPVPKKFDGFPKKLAVRPSQLRAESEDAGLTIPVAQRLCDKYRLLKMPLTLLAGGGDRLIDPEQSAEAHRQIEGSRFILVPRAGHMIHQTATAKVMSAIDRAIADSG